MNSNPSLISAQGSWVKFSSSASKHTPCQFPFKHDSGENNRRMAWGQRAAAFPQSAAKNQHITHFYGQRVAKERRRPPHLHALSTSLELG
ncbi:hypothetical protein EYF80_010790 [Liparis tanakae]|uniref:Uncharacterized protein n=1 Tax=Liparis tanakae TaxID=230148 RepID=A0A4Z2IMU4_9TELE|nr:hypothetical protein EYF80_010790 [Liparis tanakae]